MKLRNFILSGLFLGSISMFAQTHTQGIEYYKAGQFNNAKELLVRNLNNAGTDKAMSYYYLGQIAMRNGNVSEATKYFNDGIQVDADNPYNYVGLGYIALKSGDAKGAEKYFKEAESKAKKDQTVMAEIARAYYNADKVGYKDQYEKRIANALKKDPKNPDVYILEGDILQDEAYTTGDSKKYGSAAAKYDMATSYDPTSAVAYVKYADMYMNAHNPDYAIVKLEELIKNNPTSALGQRELANAYYEKNQYDKAAQKYGEYVKNPNHFKEDEDRYAFILFYDGKYKDGYDYATALLSQNPDNFSAMRYQFMNAAQIESMQGTLLPLAEKLLAAHKSKAENKFAPIDYTLIADEFARDDRTDDAISVLNEAIREIPTNANFNKQLADIYVDANNMAAASDALVDYLAKANNPGINDYLQYSIYSLYAARQNLNNDELAAKYFARAQEGADKMKGIMPNFYRPYKISGDIAMFSAKTADLQQSAAKPYYEEAIAILESNPDPRYNNDAKEMYNYLGNYYLDAKDVTTAKQYFNKVLALDPDNVDYRKFVDSLK